jgi:hypothetical protein
VKENRNNRKAVNNSRNPNSVNAWKNVFIAKAYTYSQPEAVKFA